MRIEFANLLSDEIPNSKPIINANASDSAMAELTMHSHIAVSKTVSEDFSEPRLGQYEFH